jgi:hypothetical protein
MFASKNNIFLFHALKDGGSLYILMVPPANGVQMDLLAALERDF